MDDLVSLGILFAGLIFLMLFANLADAQRKQGMSGTVWAAVCYALMILLYLGMFFGGLALWLFDAVVSNDPALLQNATASFGGENPLEMLESPTFMGGSLVVSGFFGIVLLLRPVRNLIARFIPIDGESTVHALSLSLMMLVLAQLGFILGTGLGNLAELSALAAENGQQSNQIVTLWAQQLLTALFGIVGVGFLTRLGWRETLERLGIVIPSARQVALGVGVAIALVVAVTGVSIASAQLGFGFDENVQKLTEQLMGDLFKSPLGILTAGLAAAIGEETLLRGALQPRFGLFLTTLVFALLHGQYGLSLSTAIVFAVGLILGIVRNRTNTTTAMIVHALYNIALSAMSYFGYEF